MTFDALIARLLKIESLHAGAATEGGCAGLHAFRPQ